MPIFIFATEPDEVRPLSTAPDELSALIEKYKNPQTEADRDDAIKGIYNLPAGSGTLGSWVGKNLRHRTQNPAEEAQLLIMHVLDRYQPGENFKAKLDSEMTGWAGTSHTTGYEEKSKAPFSQTMEGAIQRFLPYLKGTKKIEEDIASTFREPKVINKGRKDQVVITPEAQQIWEQYKRDAWNNQGNRIEKAKAWVEENVRRLNPANAQFVLKKAEDFQAARNVLAPAGLWAQVEDRNSPYWLSQEMIDPGKRGIGPTYIQRALQQGGGNVLCIEDKDENDVNCHGIGSEISTRDIERGRQYSSGPVQMTEDERREVMKEVPGNTAKQFRILSPAHKEYPKVIRYIGQRLYSWMASPEDEALSLVARLFAEIGIQGPESQQINRTKLNRFMQQYRSLFDRPLNFEDEPDAANEDVDANSRFLMAWEQMIKDMHRFVADKRNYDRLLSDLNIKNADSQIFRILLAQTIRSASFVALTKIAAAR